MSREHDCLLDNSEAASQTKEKTWKSLWKHFVHRGHEGKVNCVASSDNANFIVSGGQDYSMRVWYYDAVLDQSRDTAVSDSYDLCMVLDHDTERKMDESGEAFPGEEDQPEVIRLDSAMMPDNNVGIIEDNNVGIIEDNNVDIIEDNNEQEPLQRIDCCMVSGHGTVESFTAARPRGVTAVACAGDEGPMISGTARGDIYVTFLRRAPIPLVDLHDRCITEFAVPYGLSTLDDRSSWYMAASSEDGKASVMSFQDGECEIVFLHHGSKVLGIRHIDRGNKDSEDVATFATQTHKDVFVWTKGGIPLFTFSQHLQDIQLANVVETADQAETAVEGEGSIRLGLEFQIVTDIAVANKENGTLVFVGYETPSGMGARFLSVWGFDDGKLCGPYGEIPPPSSAPLVTYKDNGVSIDVDQSRNSTEFLVDLPDDYTARLWGLNPLSGTQQTELLAIKPKGPAQLLIHPKARRVVLELRHQYKVTQMRVAEDPDDADGPCAVVACESGTVMLWDLEGTDSGEVYAELRSLRYWEIALPIVFLLTTFFQVGSFAFGPDIKWKQQVKKPVSWTRRLVLGDFILKFHFEEENVVLAAITLAVGVVILILFIVLTGLPEIIDSCIYRIQSTRRYRREARVGSTGCMHTIKTMMQTSRFLLGLVILVCSTVGVAPMYRALAMSMSCCDENRGCTCGKNVDIGKQCLRHAPHIACYEDKHFGLVVACAVVVPAYSVLLVPLAAVEGRIGYLNRRKLFRPREFWAASARRMATVLNMGPLHPNPDFVFRTRVVELCAKVALPAVEILAFGRPGIQVSLVTSIGFIMWLTSVFYPPKQDRTFNCMVQDSRLFTLCAMLCGSLVVLLDHLDVVDSLIPIILLCMCAVMVSLHTMYVICVQPANPPHVAMCATSVTNPSNEERAERCGNSSGMKRSATVRGDAMVSLV